MYITHTSRYLPSLQVGKGKDGREETPRLDQDK